MSLSRSETVLRNPRYVNTREKEGPVTNGVKRTEALICLLHKQKEIRPIGAIEFHLGKFGVKRYLTKHFFICIFLIILDNRIQETKQQNSGHSGPRSQVMSLGSTYALRYYEMTILVINIKYALDAIAIMITIVLDYILSTCTPYGNNLRGSLWTQNHYSSQFPYQNLIPLKIPHHAFIIRPFPAPYKLPRCHFSHLLFFAASSQTPLNRVYPTNFRAVIALILANSES